MSRIIHAGYSTLGFPPQILHGCRIRYEHTNTVLSLKARFIPVQSDGDQWLACVQAPCEHACISLVDVAHRLGRVVSSNTDGVRVVFVVWFPHQVYRLPWTQVTAAHGLGVVGGPANVEAPDAQLPQLSIAVRYPRSRGIFEEPQRAAPPSQAERWPAIFIGMQKDCTLLVIDRLVFATILP